MPANGRWDLIRGLKVNLYVVKNKLMHFQGALNCCSLLNCDNLNSCSFPGCFQRYKCIISVSLKILKFDVHNNTASGDVTLKTSELLLLLLSLVFSVTIPDAVLVQFDLLMMSTMLLKTCRGP